MNRVLMDDEDAIAHYLMQWQWHLYMAQRARKDFCPHDVVMQLERLASDDRDKASSIAYRRFHLQSCNLYSIDPLALQMAQSRHAVVQSLIDRAFVIAKADGLSERATAERILGRDLWAAAQRQNN